MAYDDDEEYKRRRENSRPQGEPHSDVEKNVEFYLKMSKQIFIPKINYLITISVSDTCRQTDIITNPLYVGFYWSEGLRNYGHICTFHQSNLEFRKELINKFNYLLQRNMITKVNKTPSLPNTSNERKSFSDLFDR